MPATTARVAGHVPKAASYLGSKKVAACSAIVPGYNRQTLGAFHALSSFSNSIEGGND
jgi:hypothetical protein